MNEPTQTPSSTKPKKGFFQFRLTTLMVVCTIVAMIIGYGVRRYQANARLHKIWSACNIFLNADVPQIILTCDEVDGETLRSDMRSWINHADSFGAEERFCHVQGHFNDKVLPLFSSSSFTLLGRVIIPLNGQLDVYAYIKVNGKLPKFGTKPVITIHGHHQELDHVVIDELIQFAEAKFGLVPKVVYKDQLVADESNESF